MKNFENELIYFADPMCSWCWGFSPIINKITSKIRKRVGVRYIMGGLRPYTKKIMTSELREYIIGHWHNVYKKSGQNIDFGFKIGEGFVYDTEPPSRAVVTVREINKDLEFKVLSEIQKSFYVDIQDITKCSVLADIVANFGIEKALFLELFNSDELKALTKKDFNSSQAFGVRSFPTLISRVGKKLEVVCEGYQSFQNLESKLKSFIN